MKNSDNLQNPDNQHFVSQFYLRRFAMNPKASKSKKKVCVFDKSTNQWAEEPELVKKVASDHKFYSIGNDSSLEKTISKWETDFSDASALVLKQDSLVQSREILRNLAHFISFQYFRTPHAREQIHMQLLNLSSTKSPTPNIWHMQIYSFLVEYRLRLAQHALLQAKKGTIDKKQYTSIIDSLDKLKYFEEEALNGNLKSFITSDFFKSQEFLKQLHLQLVYGLSRNLVHKMTQMNWLLLNREKDLPQITSDHPTKVFKSGAKFLQKSPTHLETMASLRTEIDFDVKAYNEDECLILFPLSPNRLIMIVGKDSDIHNNGKNFFSPKCMNIPVFAKLSNFLQFIHAKQYIYTNQNLNFPQEYIASTFLSNFIKGSTD